MLTNILSLNPFFIVYEVFRKLYRTDFVQLFLDQSLFCFRSDCFAIIYYRLLAVIVYIRTEIPEQCFVMVGE